MKHGLLLVLALLLSACRPPHTAAPAQEETPMHPEQPAYPQLLDEARQLYRFKDGICRELGKLPAPWKLVDDKPYRRPGPWGHFPPGYDWIPAAPMNESMVLLVADNAAFGVAPPNTVPGKVKRGGWSQEVVKFYIGSPGLEMGGWSRGPISEILDGGGWRYPEAPFTDIPVAEGFEFYAYSVDQDNAHAKYEVYLINRTVKAGLEFSPIAHTHAPGSFSRGYLLLNPEEEAHIGLSVEALEKLDVILESMINAARAIRVECPATGETP